MVDLMGCEAFFFRHISQIIRAWPIRRTAFARATGSTDDERLHAVLPLLQVAVVLNWESKTVAGKRCTFALGKARLPDDEHTQLLHGAALRSDFTTDRTSKRREPTRATSC